MIVGVRSIGAVAEAQVNASAPNRIPAFEERPTNRRVAAARRIVSEVPDENSLTVTLARLKKSIELGPVGNAVKQTDVIPGGIYETLAKVGEVFSRPVRAERFLSYPGVAELADNPKLLALRADPQIQRMLQEGKLWALLQDDRLIQAANDPELAAQVKKFDLRKALDYAAIGGLSAEIRGKLATARPATLGAAARISGVTPAALVALLQYVVKRRPAARAA